ncbi:MAG: dihydroorotase, partial [Bacteriovoracia bacterium]
MKPIILKKCRLYNDFENVVDILIENGIIKAIDKNINHQGKIYDLSGKIALPGLVDLHVHLREPGLAYKEDIVSGSKAAAHGGFTHVFAMPNTVPVIDSLEHLNILKNAINEKAKICVTPVAALSEKSEGKRLVDFEKLINENIYFFSDDGKGVSDDELMKEIFRLSDKLNFTVCQHAQYPYPKISCALNEDVAKNYNVDGISRASEYEMVKRDLSLLRVVGGSYHVQHISTKETVELIKQAKKDNLKVTCEVTPHHLLLTQDDIEENDSNYKMNPPLRSEEDRQALFKGIEEGVIDIIATDHAPHSEDEKR